MKLFLLNLSIFITFIGSAQNYIIQHNILSDKTRLYRVNGRDTVDVNTLKVKKPGNILVKVEDFNPFYWDARVKTIKTPVQNESGYTSSFNPFSVLAGGIGNISTIFPKIDLPAARGKGGTSAIDKFLTNVSNFRENYEQIQRIQTEIIKLELAQLKLNSLKYNFQKTETNLKVEAQTIISDLFGTHDLKTEKLIDTAIGIQTELQEALVKNKELNNQIEYQNKMLDSTFVIEGSSPRGIINKINGIQKNVDGLSQKMAANPNFILTKAIDIFDIYSQIMGAQFQYRYNINSANDLSDIRLEVFPKVDTLKKDTIVKYFHVDARNILRIRNSLGVAFTYFKENNNEYFIREDSTIGRQNGNLFTPLLSTLIHFYATKSQGIRWGGAFGFGIPLQGEKKDINFLLGISAGCGQNEPLLITAGISGGKVNKISRGYKLNDKVTESDINKLITSNYDIGYYLSVTFNLSNFNISKKE